MKRLSVIASLSLAALAVAGGQSAPRDIVLAARHIGPTTPLKIFGVAGSVRLVGWDHDSVMVTGPSKPPGFFFIPDPQTVKMGVEYRLGIDETTVGTDVRPSHLVIYLPKQSRIAIRTTSADIDGTDVSGFFTTGSGAILLRGASATLDVESINGNIDINANASWLRARTGRGRLIVRGTVQDVDASTVDGELDVASSAIVHGRFSSVTGDIRYGASPPASAIFDFSNHSGAVDLSLPRDVSAALDLSSVMGMVENGLGQARPVAGGAHSLRVKLGRGDAQITVRTFKGTVRLRPSQP
jgi:putative adhesin